jgi:hypothetical protein
MRDHKLRQQALHDAAVSETTSTLIVDQSVFAQNANTHACAKLNVVRKSDNVNK